MSDIPSAAMIAEELRTIWKYGSLVANGKSSEKTCWLLMGEYVRRLMEEQSAERKVREENESISESAKDESFHYWTGVPAFDRATFEKMRKK